MTFAGKTVVVTGAGSGIGEAMVRLFRARDARVVAVDLREDRLVALGGAAPGVERVAVDLTQADAPARIAHAAGGAIDVLCNNAGVLDGLAPVDETSDDLWDRVVAVNLTAPFRLCREVLPAMVGRGRGVIVNTASVGGLRGGRAGAAYTATKFGVVGLTQNIAATYRERGIRCNAVCPGSAATNIAEGASFSERGLELMLRDGHMPAPMAPAGIAEAAVFLASDAAAHINGAVLPVDEGWIAH